MRRLPNIITFIRIVLSIVLLTVVPLSPLFLIIYIFCGITDFLDGYIARKMCVTSNLGARMDTVADLIFVIVMFITLVPLIKVPSYITLWIVVIVIIRISSITTVIFKYHTFAVLHTYSNKATGIALFFLPLFLGLIDVGILAWIICIIATLSAIEELIIHLTSKELNIDIIGIFAKRAKTSM